MRFALVFPGIAVASPNRLGYPSSRHVDSGRCVWSVQSPALYRGSSAASGRLFHLAIHLEQQVEYRTARPRPGHLLHASAAGVNILVEPLERCVGVRRIEGKQLAVDVAKQY